MTQARPPAASQRRARVRWAVAADPDGPDALALRRYLARQGIRDARWFHPKDDGALDQAVQADEVGAVLFPDAEALLRSVFNGGIHLGLWAERRARLALLRCPPTDSGWEVIPAVGYAEALLSLDRAWSRWQAARRRRRTIAGALLSVLALAAATVVILAARGL